MANDISANNVAIVGGAGFVGRQLLKHLEAIGISATVYVRGVPELSVDGNFHKVIKEIPTSEASRFDTVINLAYPNSGPAFSYRQQNRNIFSTVDALLKKGGRLIHISTLAVFGMALDRPVKLGPVSRIRDNPYVEAKIEAEQYFERRAAAGDLRLDIVRLGNVWGYASGSWALPIVQRLLTGQPLGIRGAAGFSNCTDVANVASYIAFLLDTPEAGGKSNNSARYHHLAEFYHVPWNRWIDAIAEKMQVSPVYAEPSSLQAPVGFRQELDLVTAACRPRAIYRKLAGERIAGSWARSLLNALPRKLFVKLKGIELVMASAPPIDRGEQTFLAIMAAKQPFELKVLPGWHPPLMNYGHVNWSAPGWSGVKNATLHRALHLQPQAGLHRSSSAGYCRANARNGSAV